MKKYGYYKIGYTGSTLGWFVACIKNDYYWTADYLHPNGEIKPIMGKDGYFETRAKAQAAAATADANGLFTKQWMNLPSTICQYDSPVKYSGKIHVEKFGYLPDDLFEI